MANSGGVGGASAISNYSLYVLLLKPTKITSVQFHGSEIKFSAGFFGASFNFSCGEKRKSHWLSKRQLANDDYEDDDG